MSLTMAGPDVGLYLTFSAGNWNFISTTRVYVDSYCVQWTQDRDFAGRVALVVHELLENASKYSTSPKSIVSCSLKARDGRLVVEVANEADVAHLATLGSEMALVREGDALEAYVGKMQLSLESDKSQLGLARIRYEGEAELLMKVSDRHVTVEASFALSQPIEEVA